MADYPDQLWRSVADVSGLLLTEENQETTLRRVSDLAVRSIAMCDAVGVYPVRGRQGHHQGSQGPGL